MAATTSPRGLPDEVWLAIHDWCPASRLPAVARHLHDLLRGRRVVLFPGHGGPGIHHRDGAARVVDLTIRAVMPPPRALRAFLAWLGPTPQLRCLRWSVARWYGSAGVHHDVVDAIAAEAVLLGRLRGAPALRHLCLDLTPGTQAEFVRWLAALRAGLPAGGLERLELRLCAPTDHPNADPRSLLPALGAPPRLRHLHLAVSAEEAAVPYTVVLAGIGAALRGVTTLRHVGLQWHLRSSCDAAGPWLPALPCLVAPLAEHLRALHLDLMARPHHHAAGGDPPPPASIAALWAGLTALDVNLTGRSAAIVTALLHALPAGLRRLTVRLGERWDLDDGSAGWPPPATPCLEHWAWSVTLPGGAVGLDPFAAALRRGDYPGLRHLALSLTCGRSHRSPRPVAASVGALVEASGSWAAVEDWSLDLHGVRLTDADARRLADGWHRGCPRLRRLSLCLLQPGRDLTGFSGLVALLRGDLDAFRLEAEAQGLSLMERFFPRDAGVDDGAPRGEYRLVLRNAPQPATERRLLRSCHGLRRVTAVDEGRAVVAHAHPRHPYWLVVLDG